MSQHHQRLNRRRWQHARRAALERDGYRCTNAECGGRAGKMEVHHVAPLYEGGLPYDLGNLRSLCRNCHLEHAIPIERLEWRRYIANLQGA